MKDDKITIQIKEVHEIREGDKFCGLTIEKDIYGELVDVAEIAVCYRGTAKVHVPRPIMDVLCRNGLVTREVEVEEVITWSVDTNEGTDGYFARFEGEIVGRVGRILMSTEPYYSVYDSRFFCAIYEKYKQICPEKKVKRGRAYNPVDPLYAFKRDMVIVSNKDGKEYLIWRDLATQSQMPYREATDADTKLPRL